MERISEGGCACGQVRFRLIGEPDTVGLCHCADCRKETGSAFLYYGEWRRDAFQVSGEFATYDGRSFCPGCGSRLFHINPERVEICLGALDAAPADFVPQREGWIERREPWLTAIPKAGQFKKDPFGA